MSYENHHLVPRQFINELDWCELYIQAISSLTNRPTVEKVITKVQRLWDIMSKDNSSENEDDLKLTDIETDSDKVGHRGKNSQRRKRRERERQEEKRRKKSEKKTLSKASKIRKELEELKELLTRT